MWRGVVIGGLFWALLAACSGSAGPTTSGNGPATSPGSEASASTTTRPSSVTSSVTRTVPSTPSTTLPQPLSVLVFHKTAGFRHESIPSGVSALTELGEERGFEVTATEDSSAFTREGLSAHDVIVFLNTTGDVLDGVQEQAMEAFVRAGGGFVGIHSAADTEYEWEWYGGLIGAYFSRHPAPQEAAVERTDARHPAVDEWPAHLVRFDEWYDFRDAPGPEATVLATLDETSYKGGSMGDPHPIVWAQEYAGGRSFYTGFGHTSETFDEPLVRDHLAAAVSWAAGDR